MMSCRYSLLDIARRRRVPGSRRRHLQRQAHERVFERAVAKLPLHLIFFPFKLKWLIRARHHAEPIIDPNSAHKKAVAETKKTAEWKTLYSKRSAIERLNGRRKG
ncbi:MAG: hypothetical protein MN733_20855 [Nitrososphaera sp.]|nr:hypothetical protein [Nitrososphaera sp.]